MTKADDEAKRNRKRNKEMFTTPNRWARHPILPLKRCKDHAVPPQLGFVLVQDITKVLLGNMYQMDIENRDSIIYASIDELLDDGWVID
ncbi:MAG: hypothetical protein ACLP9S_14735 [Syntrophales bacterium]